jgi:hypothetical protein
MRPAAPGSSISALAVLVLPGALALTASCSSVRPVPAPAQDPVLPAMQTYILQPGGAQSVVDYKLRTSSPAQIQLVVHYHSEVEDLPAPVKDIAFLKMAKMLGSPDVRLVTPPAEMNAVLPAVDESSRAYLAQVQADAIASIVLRNTEEEGRANVALRLIDPVTGELFGEYTQPTQIVEAAADLARQAEFYRNRAAGRYEFLDAQSAPQILFAGDARSTVRDLVLRSVSANLSVQSSSPETEVLMINDGKRKSLGRVPIASRRLREGLYRLELKRPGYDLVSREVQIRAGRDRELFITWPDDSGHPSLSVLSAPPGQRVSLDGTARGVTPLYITSIEPGAYALELSRAVSDGFEVVGEAPVEVAGSENAGRIFLVNYDENFGAGLTALDFWELAGEGDLRPEYVGAAGLAFRLTSAVPPEQADRRLGLLSRPMIIDSFDMTLMVRQIDGNELTFGLVNDKLESVLVRISGKIYTLERFSGGQAVAPLSFETIKAREGGIYPVRLQYDRDKNRLKVEIDGTEIYEGPYNGGTAARIALWTTAASADGRLLARSLRVRSGRGLYER